ncbi:MAG: hypothetical protein JWQ29_1501 [Phenylobacterium sp.]|nr:hypothetical protein [Phenylobacterium sp.]
METRVRILSAAFAVALAGGLAAAAVSQAQAPRPAAVFTADGKLEFPADYRTWVYLSSGMDMAYVEGGGGQMHAFDNVFVDPAAYAAFQKTGTWPDGTVLMLEVRGAEAHASIDKAGRSQGRRMATEVHVKDSSRFKDTGGWGFVGFNGEKPGGVIPRAAACYACHEAHAAVDTTFVQFYPTLMPISTAKGALSAAYLAEEKARVAVK